MTITQSRMMFAGVMLLLVPRMALAQSRAEAWLFPADLVKTVIRNELNTSDVREMRWKYLLVKEVDGTQETREVVETKSGSLDRLIAIAGTPLTDGQQRDETERWSAGLRHDYAFDAAHGYNRKCRDRKSG